jgi:two-component system response regulator MprA
LRVLCTVSGDLDPSLTAAPRHDVAVTRVLAVDDEPPLLRALVANLRARGYDTDTASTGEDALVLASQHPPDAVILDLGLPNMSGLEVIAGLRAWTDAPIVVLSALESQADKVAALDLGADDYVTKPFALEELLARLRALLRRTADGSGEDLRFADLELDPGTREVKRGGEPIELTRTEFSLLELFMLNPRQVLTRSLIFERVWGYDFGLTSNSLDVYIGYLRRKTETGDRPRLIQTVRGVGYALREP